MPKAYSWGRGGYRVGDGKQATNNIYLTGHFKDEKGGGKGHLSLDLVCGTQEALIES